jgi:hypothetical protein
MRRVLVLLASTALVMALGAGCGSKSYEKRLITTIEQMKYRRELESKLMPPAEGKLKTNLIYIRPPKNLAPAQKFLIMPEPEDGKFDVTESFLDAEKQTSLHVLVRVPRVKTAANKKGAPAPANRNDFAADIVSELEKIAGTGVDFTKAKEEGPIKPGLNKFKHLPINVGNKTFAVYLYGTKQSYEVALIYEYPSAEKTLFHKIDLSLGAFATGDKASRAFNRKQGEEDTEGEGGGGGEGAPPPI